MIDVIGIIGGGQLGQMMIDAAHELGFKCIVLDPQEKCPCSFNADEMIIGAYDDRDKVLELCKKSDIVTYEFENVGYRLVKEYQEAYNIVQGFNPLYYSQHRLREKNSAVKLGLKCGKFESVNNPTQLKKAIELLKLPAVLKTCSGGYDGKGQVIIKDDNYEDAIELVKNSECILEEFIKFDSEISVVVSRNPKGQITTLPIGDNIHINNILHMSVLPSLESETIKAKAIGVAKEYVEGMDFVGTITIELFVVGEELFFNEMAPRPHNSGHYSIEGASSSQFRQHILAITNQELKTPQLNDDCVMINVLGQDVEGVKELEEASLDNIYIHMYGKKEAKYNRKMGHVTLMGYSKEEAIKIRNRYWRSGNE